MTKKNDKQIENENPKINPELYWEWRTTIEELKCAKLNEKRTHLEKELKQKEIEINKLRLVVFQESVSSAQAHVKTCQAEYEKMKQRIETLIGQSLNGCVIDDVTFEVKKLEEKE